MVEEGKAMTDSLYTTNYQYNIDSIVISLKKLYIISACVVTLVLTQHDYYMVCITI